MRLDYETKQKLIIGVECMIGVLCAVLMGYFFTVRDCLLDNVFLLVWFVIAVAILVLLVRAEVRFYRVRRRKGAGQ